METMNIYERRFEGNFAIQIGTSPFRFNNNFNRDNMICAELKKILQKTSTLNLGGCL
jgi:Tfp pilus assembly ATPase PilU